MRVRKAIIPVAGLGTRMLPVTKSIPKEMLPMVDKPIIHYIVEECVEAGIKDIILVDHSLKTAVGNYFDTNYELEDTLRRKDKIDQLLELQLSIPNQLTLASVRQRETKGLGHAVLSAKDLIGSEAFVVLLPDILIESDCKTSDSNNLGLMLEKYTETGFSQILVDEISADAVDQYGIVKLADQSNKIEHLVEKPSVADAPSNLGIVGRYVLSPLIWEMLEGQAPGVGGEIQLTDAIHSLLGCEECHAYKLEGNTWDCGTKQGYVNAFVHYAKKRNFLNEFN